MTKMKKKVTPAININHLRSDKLEALASKMEEVRDALREIGKEELFEKSFIESCSELGKEIDMRHSYIVFLAISYARK